MSARDDELRVLEEDARYARECAAVYRDRSRGGRHATSTARLRHLELVEKHTAELLRRAQTREA
jgi:hypothetical protein